MKLTNPENIQESEKEFIDTINAELDWEAIEKMLLEKHDFTLQDEIEYKAGDLVVHDDDIAYRFEFEIKVPLSVVFNRKGECLEISTVRDDFEEEDDEMLLGEGEFSQEEELLENEEAVFEPIAGDLENDLVEDEGESASMQPDADNKTAQMASNIADMISEINQEDE